MKGGTGRVCGLASFPMAPEEPGAQPAERTWSGREDGGWQEERTPQWAQAMRWIKGGQTAFLRNDIFAEAFLPGQTALRPRGRPISGSLELLLGWHLPPRLHGSGLRPTQGDGARIQT